MNMSSIRTTKENLWNRLRSILCLLAAFAFCVYNAQSQSGASPKERLQGRNYSFDSDNFVKAAASGDKEAVGLFLEAGMRVDEQGQVLLNKSGRPSLATALIAASAAGKDEVVKLLLEKGAKPDLKNREVGTALLAAAGNGQIETVKILLEKAKSVNDPDGRGKTALMHVASKPGSVEVVKLLIAKGADLNLKDRIGNTAFDLARQAQQQEVESLLKQSMPAYVDIEGAFGLKLGATFDTTQGKPISPGRYSFTPDKPVEGFTRYEVEVTPKTHKVYYIAAVGPDANFGEDRLDVITAALVKKYGGQAAGNGFVYYKRDIGTRFIMLHGFGEKKKDGDGLERLVGLSYMESALQDTLEKEERDAADSANQERQRDLDNKAKSLDKSGL